MSKNLGTVVEIKTMGHGLKQMVIKLDDGSFTMFFEEFRGWNKSLKEGHRVNVFYKHSILAGYTSYKVQRVKNEKPALKLVG